MIEVTWISDERVIPGYGVATPGKAITLPDDLAAQFIRQKQATKVAPKRKHEEVQS